MALTRVSPALFQVSNNITSVTVGGSANTISLTFDSNGVITGASNNALSVANTLITGLITGSQLASNTVSNTNIQTGAVENYLNSQNYSFGIRNLLINGAMQIAQRGTTSSSTGYQTVDRWKVPNCTNQAQSSDAPTGFPNSLEVTGTVAGSSGYGIVDQFIEAKNMASNIGKTVTLSAYVKNTGTSTVNVSCEVYYANTADTFSSVTLISSLTSQSITTGWTRIVFPSFVVPSGAVNGMQVRIFRYDGSNSQKWLLTGVQLEAGSTPTAFEFRPYGMELALCQRYYIKWLANATNAGFGMGRGDGSSVPLCVITYPATMRASPTLTQSNTLINTPTSYTVSGISSSSLGTNSGIVAPQMATGTVTAGYACAWIANASTSYIDLSAEL